MRGKLGSCFSILLAAGLLGAGARAGDWPQHRADAARSGTSFEKLPARLKLRWTYKPLHPPEPAWPDDPRMTFDRAFHVAVAGGTLYFGSSADCQVRAVDAATGKQRWTFFTGGPVRFAPALWKDRAFAASDDGYLYCLSAKDGRLLWKKRGGPDAGMIIGNGRIISRWPARGGPVVVGDRVYFAAGIWPADGVYLHALEAATGKTVWSNDGLGKIARGHPHQLGKKIPAGIGVQGHLAVAGKLLLVPTGRNVPAAFELADGKLKRFNSVGYAGGSGVMVIDSLIYNGRNAYNVTDGKLAFGSGRKHANTSWAPVAATKNLIFRAGPKGLEVIDRAKPFTQTGSGRKVKVVTNVKKTLRAPCSGEVIVAGGTVYCGGKGQVAAVDAGKLAVTWTADVEGTVWGLAAAGGRLYVSTDAGHIYCFGAGGGGQVNEEKPAAAPYGAGGAHAAAAEEILKKTGVREGYCLDLGSGDGRLAYELAKRSKLLVVGVEKDPAKVAEARKRLAAAGLYGVRVTIHQGDPAKTPYPKHFANLIVSGNSVAGGTLPTREAARLQRPWGGAICAGKPGTMKPKVRGPLKGAGQWTHLYANAANTGASNDALARGPLRMRWFGGPQLDIPSRHGRPPGPLFHDGRLFAMGLQAVSAVDAYNGSLLWKFDIPDIGKMYTRRKLDGAGMSTDGSPYCVSPEGLFVRTGGTCLRLDAATGKKLGEFPAPRRPDGKPSRWGYISCAGGLLFGSITDDEHIVKYKDTRSESISLFAMDAKSGKVKWTYKPKYSVRQSAIAVGGDKLYLIDRPKAVFDLPSAKKRKGVQPPGEMVALEAATGKELWRVKNVRGTMLVLSLKNNALLVCTQSGGYALYSERSGVLAVYEASGGKLLREIAAKYYRSRPLIIGGNIHAEPYAYELASGKKTGFYYSRLHGCGIVAGSPHLLLFRSGPLGFVDLNSKKIGKGAVQFYGGTRPGCWVYAIAAGGMVLLPNSFNVCSCSYLNRTNVALETVEKR